MIRIPQLGRHTLPHLIGRFVRERDGKHTTRRHVMVHDHVANSMRNHARLAAPGACQDEQRPIDVGDRTLLLGVQPFQEIH